MSKNEHPGNLHLFANIVLCFHALFVLADLDPVVITPENPYSLDEGQDLSLTCNAVSSLSTHAFWYKVNFLICTDFSVCSSVIREWWVYLQKSNYDRWR